MRRSSSDHGVHESLLPIQEASFLIKDALDGKLPILEAVTKEDHTEDASLATASTIPDFAQWSLLLGQQQYTGLYRTCIYGCEHIWALTSLPSACDTNRYTGLIRPHPIDTSLARSCYRFRIGSFHYVVWAAIWWLIIMSFFETPTWCLREPGICNPHNEISHYYPRVTETFLHRTIGFTVEFVALGILAIDYCLQMTAEGLRWVRYHPFSRGFWHQMLLAAAFLSLIISVVFRNRMAFRGGPFLRILFLVTYSRPLRQEIKLVVRIIPQFAKAVFLLLAFFLLYAILGLSLFSPDSPDEADAIEARLYFPNFTTAFSQVFQLFLYWTFPTIMVIQRADQTYAPPNFVLCIFVFSFMIITIYFILNLALAIVCDVYNSQSSDIKKKKEEDRDASLKQVFALLSISITSSISAAEGSSNINKSIDNNTAEAASSPLSNKCLPVEALERVLVLVRTFSNMPRLTAEAIQSIISRLDPDQDGLIEATDFMRLPAVVSTKTLHTSGPRFIGLWCPALAASESFQSFSRFIESSLLEHIIDVIIVANLALALAAHDKTMLSQQDFSIFAAVIFTLEVLSKLLVMGYKRYVSSYMNIFDAVLTILSVIGAIYELGGWINRSRHHALLIFELLRILRLFRALMSVPQFKSTAKTFVKILPSASSLFLNLFFVTFVFAAAGLEAYGGLINLDPQHPQLARLQKTYYFQTGYYIFNFNDLSGGFIILTELLIDASLIQAFYEALAAVKPHRKFATYFFLVLFYCIGQLIVLNLVVAFILDAFMEAQGYEQEGEASDRSSRDSEEEGGGAGKNDGVDAASGGSASFCSTAASFPSSPQTLGSRGKISLPLIKGGDDLKTRVATLNAQDERYSMP